ncbi:DUF3883 domain-containing protein [Flagellimonas sp.]|uniref:DUF3883 domain-containing protein n=1 Tax=Flagellimonas sp. TaxID=2058762 RepID=UPI003BB11EB0
MTLEYKFVDTIEELTESTLEFHGKPEFWKPALGSGPRYFVHIKDNGTNAFGLSKFCAFKNITVEDYLTNYRYKTDGGTTQKHIASLTGQDWKLRKNVATDIKESFDNWISQFFPNYNLENAAFISITKTGHPKRKIKKLISPAELEDKLRLQREIGKIGENIAMTYETVRLRDKGIKNPTRHIEQVSKRNSAAGYDIYSSTKGDTRYIEVKSSLNDNSDFFITENELLTLEAFGQEAYLYLVHIKDLKSQEGQVYRVVKDPIRQLKETGTLKPITYRAEIKTLHKKDYNL